MLKINTKIFSYIMVITLGLIASPLVTADMDSMRHSNNQSEAIAQISDMIHDVGDHMVVIAGDLEYGTLNLEQQKAIAKHVRNMALMMDEMSQMMMQSVKEKKNHHKKMSEMRKKMDQMMKEISVGVMKPW